MNKEIKKINEKIEENYKTYREIRKDEIRWDNKIRYQSKVYQRKTRKNSTT